MLTQAFSSLSSVSRQLTRRPTDAAIRARDDGGLRMALERCVVLLDLIDTWWVEGELVGGGEGMGMGMGMEIEMVLQRVRRGW